MSRKRKAKDERRARRPTPQTRRRLRATPAVPRPKSRKDRAKPRKPTTRRMTARGASGGGRRRATTGKKPTKRVQRPTLDPRFEPAIKEMNRGQSMTAAARAAGVPRYQLQNYLTQQRLASRKRGRWVAKDKRPRRVPVMTRGRIRVVIVPSYDEAQLAGEHWHRAGEFVRTNDIELIKPFQGKSVQAVSGRRYPLETDPNALHRIAAMDSPPFHEIYEITSTT